MQQFLVTGEFGVGVVSGNFRGHVLAAKIQRFPGDIDARRAETIAAKEGLLLAWELGFKSIILEGDANGVFDNFGAWNYDLSQSGAIMHDTIHIVSWFSFFKACFIPRLLDIVM